MCDCVMCMCVAKAKSDIAEKWHELLRFDEKNHWHWHGMVHAAQCALEMKINVRLSKHPACVGPGHCCYRVGPIRFHAGWRKTHSWTRVSLVLLGLVVQVFCVVCIISVSLVCLDYFAKSLASQAVCNDAYIVEEYISTKRHSCMTMH